MIQLHAFYLGIIEGLTEFLPISSTGHLMLASRAFTIPQTDFLVAFEIAIQLGAILAVVCMYWKKLFTLPIIKRLIVGFIPTGIVGFLVYPFIKQLLTNPLIVGVTLFLGGLIILFVEHYYYKVEEAGNADLRHHVTFKQAFLLGVYQTFAVVPGVSRSGATIVGGLLMKMNRQLVTEFSFLLAVPTMTAATLYSSYKNIDVIMHAGNLSTLLIGMGTSFVVATFVIKLFLDYIRKHSFVVFGIYRILVGIIVFAIFFPK